MRPVTKQRRAERRQQAEARTAEYRALTLEQKLRRVDARPGKSRREWLRLTGDDVGGYAQ